MRRASLVALLLAGGAAIHGATAQEGIAPSRVSATISQSLEADTNYDLENDSPGTTVFGDTRLELGLARETRTQSLLLGIDTALRALDRADEPFEFTLGSPTGGLLDYEVEGPNFEFDSLLRYRQTRTDFNDFDAFVTDEGFLPDDLTSEDLRSDTREERFDVDIGGTWGTSSPNGFSLRFSGTDIGYSDDASNLTPRRYGQVAGAWTLRLNPVLSSIVAAEYYEYDADNPADTDVSIAEIDAGVVYEPDENLRLRGGIGYAHRVREDLVNGERETTQDESGPTIRGDVLWVRDDFQLVGDARLTTAAPETRLGFNLRGVYALARGELIGRVFNRYTGDSGTGTETRISGFGVAFDREINTLSGVRFDVAYATQEFLDLDQDNTDRTIFTATYRRDLTPVVSAEMGYRFTNLIEAPDTDADSNRVFFRIGRTFETGL